VDLARRPYYLSPNGLAYEVRWNGYRFAIRIESNGVRIVGDVERHLMEQQNAMTDVDSSKPSKTSPSAGG
jgi:hypothetical protein